MIQPKVKIRNIKTKVIMEVKKVLADDFIGTGEFELVKENEESPKPKNFNINK